MPGRLLLWQVDNLRPLLLRHLGTRVTNPGDQVSRTSGQIHLGGRGRQRPGWHGVGLDPVVGRRGGDGRPLSVVTNLRLVNPDGDALTPLEALRHLNEVVRTLRWQDEVERVLMVSAQPPKVAATRLRANVSGCNERTPLAQRTDGHSQVTGDTRQASAGQQRGDRQWHQQVGSDERVAAQNTAHQSHLRHRGQP